MKTITHTLAGLFAFIQCSGQITNASPYCNVTLGGLAWQQENSSITNVKISTLNNTTGFYEGNSKFHYYNNVPAPNITAGSQQTLSVTFGGAPDLDPIYFTAYIDYNGNNVFDPTELVLSNGNSTGAALPTFGNATTVTKVLTIPNNAVAGVRRMRVIRGADLNGNTNFSSTYFLPPCPVLVMPFFYGEIEDYDLNILSQPAPVANFSVSSLICSQKPNVISDLSTNTPTAWAWNIAGPSSFSYSTQNPTVTFSTAGTYSITLSATNAGGASAPVTKTINVMPSPTLNILSASNPVCKGKTFSLSVSGAASYTWNTGATNSVITQSLSVTTTFTAIGKNSSGCSNSASKTITVSACTGIDDLSAEETSQLVIYPNPFSDHFKVHVSKKMAAGTSIKIYNTLGQLIQTTPFVSGEDIYPDPKVTGSCFLVVIENKEEVQRAIIYRDFNGH